MHPFVAGPRCSMAPDPGQPAAAAFWLNGSPRGVARVTQPCLTAAQPSLPRTSEAKCHSDWPHAIRDSRACHEPVSIRDDLESQVTELCLVQLRAHLVRLVCSQ